MAGNKGFLYLLVFFLLSSLALAARDDALFSYHALNLRLDISNDLKVRPVSSDFYLSQVTATLAWYPVDDYRQIVESITTEPMADFKEGDGFFFRWDSPSQNSFELKETAKLTTKNEFLKVTKKVPFPIKDLDPEIAGYLKPQEIIDVNDDIKSLASSLVKGDYDLFSATSKLAEWVEDNVEYNLTSMTADASQKASWVMINRRGVCDELTSLFISMCRSVGIPARFVTGISYSNINLQNDGWGPHGWAEVYFPGYGWVPFDVTYKELGYIDATHIKLRATADARETSVDYTTRGNGGEMVPGPLESSVAVIGKDYRVEPVVDIKLEMKKAEVGFGSYNLVIATVKNLEDYYVAGELFISKVTEMEIISEPSIDFWLAPLQEKRLYWLVRVSPGLDPSFTYTFPLKVRNSRGEEASGSFKASRDGKVFSEKYMQTLIEQLKPAKPYADKLLISCSSDKEELFLSESVRVNCLVKNNGSTPLEQLKVCLEQNCSLASIGEFKAANFNYVTKFETLGVKTLTFKTENSLVDNEYYLVIDVQDKPLIDISNLSYPETINYGQAGEVVITMRRRSGSQPQNIRVSLDHELISHEWTLSKLESDYEFRILINGADMVLDKNDFLIKVAYQDIKGNNYQVDNKFSIILNNPTFFQRLTIRMNILDRKMSIWLSKLFNKI
ncbi:MAG: transglutaminase domain-containing protein [archaeon]